MKSVLSVILNLISRLHPPKGIVLGVVVVVNSNIEVRLYFDFKLFIF
jgi:hypothetical protein